MRTAFVVLVLLTGCMFVHSQAVPSANSGTALLHYSGYYSEMAEFGDRSGDWHTITPSASLNYSNGKKQFPFSLAYAGGYTSTLSGPTYTTGVFQRLLLSQGVARAKWALGASDDVSYRPQTPTTGFSGIPGIGEPIGGVGNPPTGQLILALNTHALENIAHGDFERILNYLSSLHLEATHDLLHYTDSNSNGLDTSSAIVSAGIDFRLNARNSIVTRYAFSEFSFSGYDLRIRTSRATVGFEKSWTRALKTSAMAGPEWVAGSNGAIVPNSIGAAAKAALNYQLPRTAVTLGYERLTSAGSGYMIGSESNSVSASLSRQFARPLELGVTGGYSRNSQLLRAWNTSGIYGGTQASWRIGRNLEAFVNYTVISQNSSNPAPSNILNEVLGTISCGIGFTKEARPSR